MNVPLLLAGLSAAGIVVGHLLLGSSWYLRPVLAAEMEEVPKKQMHAVFHYASAFPVLSALVLLGAAFGLDMGSDPTLAVQFIAATYILMALSQVAVALTAKAPKLKFFQWILFAVTGVLAVV